jgi:quercetin dioxygenase-like cupin family protein
MLTSRDLIVATVSALSVLIGVAVAETNTHPVMHSSVFNWADLKATPTKSGEVRAVFNAPTPALAQFECHITTLKPGEAPHPPHQHPDEELIIVKEGTVEALQGDQKTTVPAGGIIFEASNELHGIRNIGETSATYYLFKILPHDLAKTK